MAGGGQRVGGQPIQAAMRTQLPPMSGAPSQIPGQNPIMAGGPSSPNGGQGLQIRGGGGANPAFPQFAQLPGYQNGFGTGQPVNWAGGGAPGFQGQSPYATPQYPQLQGGYYNRMTQMLAGPQWQGLRNPYAPVTQALTPTNTPAPPNWPNGT